MRAAACPTVTAHEREIAIAGNVVSLNASDSKPRRFEMGKTTSDSGLSSMNQIHQWENLGCIGWMYGRPRNGSTGAPGVLWPSTGKDGAVASPTRPRKVTSGRLARLSTPTRRLANEPRRVLQKDSADFAECSESGERLIGVFPPRKKVVSPPILTMRWRNDP